MINAKNNDTLVPRPAPLEQAKGEVSKCPHCGQAIADAVLQRGRITSISNVGVNDKIFFVLVQLVLNSGMAIDDIVALVKAVEKMTDYHAELEGVIYGSA